MKEDVERKEKQQAAIIDSQAKKLEELDKSYKDESLLRKRWAGLGGVGWRGWGGKRQRQREDLPQVVDSSAVNRGAPAAFLAYFCRQKTARPKIGQ